MTSESAAAPEPVLPASAPAAPTKRVRGRAGWIVATVFAFLFAVDVFEALSNLIGLTQSFASVDVAMPANALGALIGLVAAPIVVYALILWATRRMRTGSALLVFLVGFAVAAVITLDLQSVYRGIVPFVIPS
ncbi:MULTISPECIES: hypothetical protein [Subtercola]|uniref:Uncharacterized protein n=1 Tax=Subtercola vilae TaxID=2056433 RepID=A0A4V4RFL1_9MICO|nr:MULTISPECIES: hypothetical protein [Subtercola]MEA9985854.1 hypothetical protein [Subtercola sp. RTI3]TIH32294.1 hypothetical protein D4765_15760 [Subtercola vilae]